MVERGKLSVKDFVNRHVPEFGRYGKEFITIEQLLVHTAGIPYADVSMWSAMHKWDEVRGRCCPRCRAVALAALSRSPRPRPRLASCPLARRATFLVPSLVPSLHLLSRL